VAATPSASVKEPSLCVDNCPHGGSGPGQFRAAGLVKFPQRPQVPPDHPFTLAAILPEGDAGIDLHVELSPGVVMPEAQRRYVALHGIDPNAGARSYTFGLTLLTVLDRALVRLGDSRLVVGPRGLPLPRRAGGPVLDESLPNFLLDLKLGSHQKRQRYRDICVLFSELSRGRTVDVGQGADSSVVVRVGVGRGFEVPIEFAGSGAWELLVLASTLGYGAGALILLDEPGAGLHPTLQRILLDRLERLAAQVIIVTHSPALLPPPVDPGPRLVRLAMAGSATQAACIEGADYRSIARKLRAKGNEGVPFAERVILCEGEGDVAATRGLAERLAVDVDGSNIVVVDCGGKLNLPDYIDFAGRLHIPFLAVMDGDATKCAQQPSLKKRSQAVRSAASRYRGTGTVFSFDENIEHAVGLRVKGVAQLEHAAATVSLRDGEVGRLVRRLRKFLSVAKADGDV
jgi:hypothetical protein